MINTQQTPWKLLWAAGLCAVSFGCSGADATGIPPVLTLNPYTALHLNVEAAVMSTVAPYDTLQLVPTMYDAVGTSIPRPGIVTYTVSDTTLGVSSTGLVTVKHQTAANSYVIVTVQDTVQSVTHADTAYILATTTIPAAPIASFSMQPVTGDSAILDMGGGGKQINVTAFDANHNPIPSTSFIAHFFSAITTVATVGGRTGVVTAVSPGTTHLTASVEYYHVMMRDSLPFTIGWQDFTIVSNLFSKNAGTPNASRFVGVPVAVGVGKTVIFATQYAANVQNEGGDQIQNLALDQLPLSVVFDDSDAVQPSPASQAAIVNYFYGNPASTTGSGNIMLTVPVSLFANAIPVGGNYIYYPDVDNYCNAPPYPCAAARSFPKAGTYHFHSAIDGSTGTILVVGPTN